jgi:predicted lipoprotein with Yx(FWY)xxD motif
MKRPRIIVAGTALAAVLTAAGLTTAATNVSSAASFSRAPVVRTARTTVGGKTETILVSSHGLPLYFYRLDTASRSFVSGGLARLWPPLTSGTSRPVAAPGVTGLVGELRDANGQQVTYKGHPLYTFVDDHSGLVTGQGVQNFFVATPGITSIGAAARSATPAAPAAPGGGFRY